MNSDKIGKFDFTNFIGCKLPQQEPRTLVQIVKNLLTLNNTQGISPLSGVIRNVPGVPEKSTPVGKVTKILS